MASSIGAEAAPTNLAQKPLAAIDTSAVSIAPHRALYDMSMTSVKNGSTVTGVSGTMIFEWADACEGWAVQQNLQLHFTHTEGDETNVASNEVTWESKDGKRYNFNIRRTNDGKETENFRGKANLASGKALYTTPEGKTADLPNDTLFPSTHTRMIIANAKAGEHFFTRRVFDGSDEDGSNDVSVYIGSSAAAPLVAVADGKLAANPLLNAPTWPIHMAFFKLNDDTGEPDYEMDMMLQNNGVVRTLRIDYGDFSVTGTLKAIEPVTTPHC